MCNQNNHRKFKRTKMLAYGTSPLVITPDNICDEYVFLKPRGEDDINFTLAVFKVRDVAAYLTKTKSNLVMFLLHLNYRGTMYKINYIDCDCCLVKR